MDSPNFYRHAVGSPATPGSSDDVFGSDSEKTPKRDSSPEPEPPLKRSKRSGNIILWQADGYESSSPDPAAEEEADASASAGPSTGDAELGRPRRGRPPTRMVPSAKSD